MHLTLTLLVSEPKKTSSNMLSPKYCKPIWLFNSDFSDISKNLSSDLENYFCFENFESPCSRTPHLL